MAGRTLEGRLVRILLVEDSPEDVLLTRESLKEAKVANELFVADDGEEALDFVHRRGRWSDAPRPDLIVLDLNLPRMDGRDGTFAISNSELNKLKLPLEQQATPSPSPAMGITASPAP